MPWIEIRCVILKGMVMLRIAAVIIALAIVSRSTAIAAPDEDILGKKAGYPIGNTENWFFKESVRVGSFSNLDKIVRHNILQKSPAPLLLSRTSHPPTIEYQFDGKVLQLSDFLARQRVTGLLLIKNGEIFFEQYQYDRSASHRFLSHSMAKSIVSLGVGIALGEGKIRSLDDIVARYEPKLAGNPYGETTIRNLLRMSSGVRFSEIYDGKHDATLFTLDRHRRSNIEAIREFKIREFEQGTRFHYASIENAVLAVMLRAVTGGTLTKYLTPRLWQPIGAAADATWVTTHDGLEVGSAGFNATLLDYGRLGMLLANDGAVGLKQVVPREYLLEATEAKRQPEVFGARRATRYFGYGYNFWIFPGDKRRFAMLGAYGQSIFVDPELKLVMVVTAVTRQADDAKDPFGAERDAVWRGVVRKFGSW